MVPPPVGTIDDQENEGAYHLDEDDQMNFDPPSAAAPQLYGAYQQHIGGFSNGTVSMNAGTINQLQMFSPPSIIGDDLNHHIKVDESNNSRINLGTYGHD